MTAYTFEKVPMPAWVQPLWDEIDNKTFGESLNIFTDDAEMIFGVGHWQGRETIREKLRQFDEGMDTKHEVLEFWDGGPVKVFHGRVKMTSHEDHKTVEPVMTHFFYMDERNPSKVRRWIGSVGPVKF